MRLGLGRHCTFRYNYLFSIFYFFGAAVYCIVSIFVWNSVRIWSWMIHYGLIHHRSGTGSCLVVKKVKMSEKITNKIQLARDRPLYLLTFGAPYQTTDLHNICANRQSPPCLRTIISHILIVTGPH